MSDTDKGGLERQLGSKQPKAEEVSIHSQRPKAETAFVQPVSRAPAKPKEKD